MHMPSAASAAAHGRAQGTVHGSAYGPGYSPRRGPFTWPRRAEAWLDSKGRGAWIAAMVLGFVFAWPIGLFLALYITWTHRWSSDMFGHSCRARRQMTPDARSWGQHWGRHGHGAFRPSGNSTFDNYKAETLRRLEEEQEAFEGFLQRLREAKDKKEFDAFMEDRAQANRAADAANPESDAGETDARQTDAGPARGAPGAEDPRKGEY